jgi:hypothetical protein
MTRTVSFTSYCSRKMHWLILLQCNQTTNKFLASASDLKITYSDLCNADHVFKFRSGHTFAMHLLVFVAKQPNLKLHVWPIQNLMYLPINISCPNQLHFWTLDETKTFCCECCLGFETNIYNRSSLCTISVFKCFISL